MRLLWLAHNDYGNSGYWFASAMARAGHEVRYFKEVPHVFRYAVEGPVATPADWAAFEDHVRWADVVHIIQSDLPVTLGGEHPPLEFWPAWYRPQHATILIGVRFRSRHRTHAGAPNLCRDRTLDQLRAKRVVVLHGGSFYRHVPDYYRQLWQGIADRHVCYSADLLGVFPGQEQLVLPPIDTDMIRPPARGNGPLRIGHFPGNANIKGTATILGVIRAIQARRNGFEWACSDLQPNPGVLVGVGCRTVPWADQLARTGACDVVIDQLAPTENGRPFGEWVSQSTEAAAMGCVTVTNSHRPEVYAATYGERPALHLCNTPESLRDELERLLGLSQAEIRQEQAATRAWAVRCHGYARTARLFEEQVYTWI